MLICVGVHADCSRIAVEVGVACNLVIAAVRVWFVSGDFKGICKDMEQIHTNILSRGEQHNYM